MIQRLLVLLPLLLLMVPLTLRAAPEERPPIAFQVYLWPGTPNPNLEAKKKERKAGDDFENMVSYVAPTLQFSPDGKAQVQDIQAAERRLSPVYRYRGANPLVFFRAESIGDGEARRVPLGSVNLAPSAEPEGPRHVSDLSDRQLPHTGPAGASQRPQHHR
jgi:hypothetical protein